MHTVIENGSKSKVIAVNGKVVADSCSVRMAHRIAKGLDMVVDEEKKRKRQVINKAKGIKPLLRVVN